MDVGAVAAPPGRAVAEGGAQRCFDEADGGLREAGVRGGAAPGPVERVEDDPGLDRVARDVAGGPEEVVVVGYSPGEAMRFEQVRAATVAHVVFERVAAV